MNTAGGEIATVLRDTGCIFSVWRCWYPQPHTLCSSGVGIKIFYRLLNLRIVLKFIKIADDSYCSCGSTVILSKGRNLALLSKVEINFKETYEIPLPVRESFECSTMQP